MNSGRLRKMARESSGQTAQRTERPSPEQEIDAPDDAWNGEVFRRKLGGEDEEMVRAEVIARYLDSLDPRPLLDAIDHARPLPASILRRLAVMLDENHAPLVNDPVNSVILIQRWKRSRQAPQ